MGSSEGGGQPLEASVLGMLAIGPKMGSLNKVTLTLELMIRNP